MPSLNGVWKGSTLLAASAMALNTGRGFCTFFCLFGQRPNDFSEEHLSRTVSQKILEKVEENGRNLFGTNNNNAVTGRSLEDFTNGGSNNTITDWSLDGFNIVDRLGSGTYGIVYKGVEKKTGKFVAMKKIRLEGDTAGLEAALMAAANSEAFMLLRHPNIVSLEDVIMQENRPVLIFEFIQMDLKRFMDNINEDRIEKMLVKSFVYQICQGICFCHQRRVLHRDLKPQNMLVNPESLVIKLADFGCACEIPSDNGVPNNGQEVVSLWYRAPELLLGADRYSTGVDIWSIGCIFAELARKKPLLHGQNDFDQMIKIISSLSCPAELWKDLPNFVPEFGYYQFRTLETKMSAYFDEAGLDLLSTMFLYNPTERISAKQILKHPYFDDLDKSQLPAPPVELDDDEEADPIILAVDMTADAPHGVKWNSKKDTGCIGLKNQGATCFLNSILQTLFFTNKLRKAVYQMPTEDDNPDSSVALAMQRVLYELQFSESPVDTKKLTKSFELSQTFGWDHKFFAEQQDVHEFDRVLLDNLENKMKNTKVGDTIPSLFKGRMKSYIKCKEVSFESSREECFYDIQLNVKNKANVMESFKDYIEPEIMDGEDKYDAGEHGLQPAEKGLKFISFPPVLHLQLMRFHHDPLLGTNVKINDRFEFPDVLELHEFVDAEKKENIKSDYVYLLHAVLVHSGDFHGGHYVAFINMNLNGTPKWCKFDDDVVSRVAHRDAVTANFGGENPDGIGRANTNAYMLVYIQKNAVEEVLCPLAVDDIPEHLKVRFDSETKKEMEKKIEREDANNYCEITLILDEEMKAHHGFELFDHNLLEVQNRKMKVQKNMNFKELYKFVAKNLNVPENSFRLWDFQEADDRLPMHRFMRPRYFLDPNDIDDEEMVTVRADKTVYLEMGKLEPDGEFTLTPFNRRTDTFIFLKFYNTERKLTEFKGTMILNLETEISSYHEEMNQLIGLPSDTRIDLYIELKPDRIVPIDGPLNILKVRDEPNLHQKGAIIVAEIAEKVTGEMNTQAYFLALSNKIER